MFPNRKCSNASLASHCTATKCKSLWKVLKIHRTAIVSYLASLIHPMIFQHLYRVNKHKVFRQYHRGTPEPRLRAQYCLAIPRTLQPSSHSFPLFHFSLPRPPFFNYTPVFATGIITISLGHVRVSLRHNWARSRACPFARRQRNKARERERERDCFSTLRPSPGGAASLVRVPCSSCELSTRDPAQRYAYYVYTVHLRMQLLQVGLEACENPRCPRFIWIN